MIQKLKLKIIKKLSKNKKNVAKILTGTFLAQGISLITLPIFTRIYGAEVFGTLALLSAISIIINSFSDLGLTNAIMTEDSEKRVIKIYKVISSIVAPISLFTGILIVFYHGIFLPKLEVNVLFLFSFVVISTFTSKQIHVCYTWLNRNERYNILMKNPLISGIILGAVGISLGLMGFVKYGYFIASILGQIATLIHMKRFLPKNMFTLNVQDYRDVVTTNRKFVVFQLPTNILVSFKNQLPQLLISTLWGVGMLGYYSITVRLLQLPIKLIANSLGRVFFQTTSVMYREGKNIGDYVYKTITTAMKIGFLPMFILMSLGDIIVVTILGTDWEIAGYFIQILSIQYFFMFLTFTTRGVSITIGKQKYAMISNCVQVVAYIIGATVGRYVFNDIFIALILMSSLFITINIIYYCNLFKVMGVSWIKYLIHIIFNIYMMLTLTAILRLWIFN